jgi:RNA polymerase sigma factor (sigma-70 family)
MQELVLAHPGGTSRGESPDNSRDVPCDSFRVADDSSRLGAEAASRELFESLLVECGPLAFRVARGVLRNTADAEDVAQEALLRAYRRFRHLRERDRFRAWLVRIAFRLALDRVRTARRREMRETMWARPERSAPVASAEDLSRAAICCETPFAYVGTTPARHECGRARASRGAGSGSAGAAESRGGFPSCGEPNEATSETGPAGARQWKRARARNSCFARGARRSGAIRLRTLPAARSSVGVNASRSIRAATRDPSGWAFRNCQAGSSTADSGRGEMNLGIEMDSRKTSKRFPGGKMKKQMWTRFALAAFLAFPNSAPLLAQGGAKEEMPKAESAASASFPAAEQITPLKIQVLLTEFDGGKKVKSLPYVSYVNAISNSNRHEFTKIRLGTKVPVYAGKEAGMQYIDVGTNIDCSASQSETGTYRLRVVVERSWVDGSSDLSGTAGQLPEPIIRQFKNEMELTLRDGQTSEPTVATDSMTGKVMKIEVSLSVLKSL